MLSGESSFTILKYEIEVKKLNHPITLIPFGDVHYDSPLAARDRFKSFCDDARKIPDALFLGMGDYLDLASYTDLRLRFQLMTRKSQDDLFIPNYESELFNEQSFAMKRHWGVFPVLPPPSENFSDQMEFSGFDRPHDWPNEESNYRNNFKRKKSLAWRNPL